MPICRIVPVMLAIIFVSVLTTPANAQSSSIGMYTDEARTSWCVNGSSPYQIEVKFYATIPGDGIFGYGFDLKIPPNLEFVTWYTTVEHRLEICDPEIGCPGIDGAFVKCQTGWVHLRTAVFNVTSSSPGILETIPHPVSGIVGLSNCASAPFVANVLTRVYINYDPLSSECTMPVPARSASWGRIKALYADD